MQPAQQSKIMMSLVDKLCDHLPNDRIKNFIDNGFDQWETVTYIKGPQLVQLGFTAEEVIIIIVAINSNAKQFKLPEIFDEEQVQQTLKIAKQNDQQRMEQIEKEQEQYHKNSNIDQQNRQDFISKEQSHDINIKQYPQKILNQALMLKSLPIPKSSKPSQKPSLNKLTLIQLQGKQITRLCEQEMKKIPSIQNLYLANNKIYKMEGFTYLTKIKILRLQNNLIKKIQGLDQLINLQRLTLNENYLQKIQNLENNKKLHYLDISSQKHKFQVTFCEITFESLSYCLEKLDCNNNFVRNIDGKNFCYIKALIHLAVAQEISLKNNQLQQISQLTEALTKMQRLKKIDFRGNPITKVPKYRDYIVILSKSLQQLDQKKILPKQRQYLVKLYSLKHAKQQKQIHGQNKKPNTENKNLDLYGHKIDQNQHGNAPKYVHGGDLRGNITHANTKVVRK